MFVKRQDRSWQVVVISVLLALAVSILPNGTAHAAGEGVSIGSLTQNVGVTGSVSVRALNLDVPPLGAWQVDISYKPGLLTAVECTPRGDNGVCNLHFANDTVRLVGVAVDGIHGASVDLAALRFTCDAEGTSPLTLAIDTFADVNGFQMPFTIENGKIECLAPGSTASLTTTATLATPTEREQPTDPGGTTESASSGGGGSSFAVIAVIGGVLGALVVGGLSYRYVSGKRDQPS